MLNLSQNKKKQSSTYSPKIETVTLLPIISTEMLGKE